MMLAAPVYCSLAKLLRVEGFHWHDSSRLDLGRPESAIKRIIVEPGSQQGVIVGLLCSKRGIKR
jgi:hypothetical protein